MPEVQSSVSTFTPDYSDLTPEEILELETKVLPTAELKSPQAKRLYELGFSWKKAMRHDDCKKHGQTEQCNMGHIGRTVFGCTCRFCLKCAPVLAKDILTRWRSMLELFTKQRFTFLTLEFPFEGTPKEAAALFEDLENPLINDVERHEFGPGWRFMHDRMNGRIKFRILTFDVRSNAEWQALWPEAKVEVHNNLPGYLLIKWFDTELLNPDLSPSPKARAESEVFFAGMDRFAAMNIHLGDGHRDGVSSSVVMVDPTDQSLQCNCSGKHRKCRICHGPIVLVSEIFTVGDPEPRPTIPITPCRHH